MISILIVDDHQIIRTGLSLIFETVDGMEVVAQASDGKQALGMIEAYRPDIVISDIRMPVMDGIALLKALKDSHPELPVIVLTTFDDQEPVQQAMRLGAKGFLLKDATKDTIVSAVRNALNNKVSLDPQIAGKAFSQPEAPQLRHHLTPRELQILQFVVAGERNKDIANLMSLSERTIKSELTSVYHKLKVYSRTEAVAVALREGIVRQ